MTTMHDIDFESTEIELCNALNISMAELLSTTG
jgi:hypothetical protein